MIRLSWAAVTAVGLIAWSGQAQWAAAATYNYPADPLPASLSAGDVLNVSALIPFAGLSTPPGSTINILSGGGIEFALSVGGTINVEPGAIGLGSWTLDGGLLNARGGLFGPTSVINGATAIIDGGGLVTGISARGSSIELRSGTLIGAYLVGEQPSTLDIYSDGLTGEVVVDDPSAVRFHGGELSSLAGPSLKIYGQLDLVVQQAQVNGAPIPGLTPGDTAVVTERNVPLTATLADGSLATISLNEDTGDPFQRYAFDATAVVSVTQIPEPSALAQAGVMLATMCGAGLRARKD